MNILMKYKHGYCHGNLHNSGFLSSVIIQCAGPGVEFTGSSI